jgi:hypothetical protein
VATTDIERERDGERVAANEMLKLNPVAGQFAPLRPGPAPKMQVAFGLIEQALPRQRIQATAAFEHLFLTSFGRRPTDNRDVQPVFLDVLGQLIQLDF